MQAVRPGTSVALHQAFRCCPFAGAVSSQVHAYLEANGFVIAESRDNAEVHVVNTCGSDASQAQITWDTVAEIRRRAPTARIVALGCLVSIEPRRLAEVLAGVAESATFDPRHTAGLDRLFGGTVPYAQVQPAQNNEYVGNDFAKDWHHIVASTGCLGTCSFCAIRRATGRPRSRAIADVLADVARGRASGRLNQLLVSTDLSAWGTDLGLTVVDLLAAVTEAAGNDVRLAGESFEPTLFLEHFEALLPLFASGRWAYLGVPIQSGSTRVLREMSRTYDPEAVLAAVARLKAAAPDLILRTDLIFGFGEETEAEFEASIVASRSFDLPSFNAYQERPGTLPLKLPPEVLLARRDRALAELKARADQGWATIRRAGGETQAPAMAAPGGKGGAEQPWDTAEGRAWLVAEARRYALVLRKRPEVPLGAGWSLVGVRVEPDALLLTLRHTSGVEATVAQRQDGWPGGAMARGARAFVQERGEPVAGALHTALKIAVRALV